MRQNRVKGFAGYDLSEDGQKVLVGLSGRLYAVSLDGKSIVEVAAPDDKGGFPFDQRFSPDGKSVSFVRDGELWVAPAAGGKARQLTKGSTPTLVHAQAEFVAQEEMDRFTGYWWSPDSKWIAYEEYDASKVEKLVLSDPSDPFAAGEAEPYPRPGTPNVVARLGVLPAGGGKTTWITWDHAKYEYLVDVDWQKGGPLTLWLMNRAQTELSLVSADPRTGKTRELVHEHDDAWLDTIQGDLRASYVWLEDGSGFLWAAERDDALRLELHGPDGKLVRPLTTPELGFDGVVHVDSKAGTVIVSAAPEPVDAAVYQVSLTSGEAKPLSDPDVFTRMQFARRSDAHLVMHSAEDKDFPVEVVRADGTSAGTLPEVSEAPPFVATPVVRKLGGFWTLTVKPRDFDPKKKYPVLVEVYGGPGITMVHRDRRASLQYQWIADHGLIVVSIDGRGTPGRGRAWERALKGKFAEVPLADQIAGLQAIAAVEPAMDLSRVGVFGWSFGGFMAALSVERRPDVYKAAVSGAPVSDWLDYDTTYTERYLGVPDRAKDTLLYDTNGLLPYAKDLSRPLLLIHGSADDNVHLSHTLKLVDALFAAGRPFELLTLAGETHSPRAPDRNFRMYQRIFEFFRANL
jgi:dipeptidyl-peptidase-4